MKTTKGSILHKGELLGVRARPPIVTAAVGIIGIFYLSVLPSVFGIKLNQIQAQPTLTPTASPVATSQAVPVTATVNPIDIIAQVSEHTMQTSSNVITLMQWLVATVVTVSIAAAGAFWHSERETAKKIAKIERDQNALSETLIKVENQISGLFYEHFSVQQDLHDLPNRMLPYEEAVKAFEAGKITKSELIESQVWHSWQKWIFLDDMTGFDELIVHKESQEGLPRSIVRAGISLFSELMDRQRHPGAFRQQDQDRLTKLSRLLNLAAQS